MIEKASDKMLRHALDRALPKRGSNESKKRDSVSQA